MTTNGDQYAAGDATMMLHWTDIANAVAKDPTVDFACMMREDGVRSWSALIEREMEGPEGVCRRSVR